MSQGVLIVTWEVDDGYAGKSRPQTTKIPLGDLEGRDRQSVIEEYVQEDFQNKVSWSIISERWAD